MSIPRVDDALTKQPLSPQHGDATVEQTSDASTAVPARLVLEREASDLKAPLTPEPSHPSTDTTRYDSVWNSSTEIPSKEPLGFERIMVDDGKIFVVLGVVLIIWIGLLAFLFSTDRRLRSLERDNRDER